MESGSRGTREQKRAGAADLEIVRGVLAREPVAIRAFIQRMRCVARFLSMRNERTGRPLSVHDLEDLTQEVLVSVWKRLGDFDGRARLETWVFQFCYLQFLRRLRTDSHRPRHARVDDPCLGADPGLAAEPVPAHDQHEPLYLALDRLGSEEAGLLRLKHFEGLTFDAMGTRLRISPNTAKTRYYKALAKLGTALGPGYGDQP